MREMGRIASAFQESINGCDNADFQIVKATAVAPKIAFLCLGKSAAQKSGKMNSPAKSESFPVKKVL